MRHGLLRWFSPCALCAFALFLAACDSNTGTSPFATQPLGSTDAAAATTLAGGSQVSSSAPATQLEQLSLERINRARLRPAQEAAMFGIAIDEGIPGQLDATPRQPVAMNAKLSAAARAHSQDMLARDYFEHDSPEGVTPFTRMTNAGYVFITAGENLAWRGTTGLMNEISTVEGQHSDLFIDTGIEGRGHRVTMLNGSLREVGISTLRGNFTNNGTQFDSMMQTQDYGTAPNSPTFVLGVIYSDINSNGRYDAGEGQPSAAVTLGDATVTTNAGGGYSFAVTASGTYTIKFSGNRTQVLDIVRGQKNIKVDLVNGNTIVVNLGIGILN